MSKDKGKAITQYAADALGVWPEHLAAFGPCGLTLTGKETEQQLAAIVRAAGRMSSGAAWYLGDALATAEDRKLSLSYDDAERLTGIATKTLQNWTYIARRVPAAIRRPVNVLSHAHHAEVAALDRSEQERWLLEAEAGKLSRNALRSRMHAITIPAALPAQSTPRLPAASNAAQNTPAAPAAAQAGNQQASSAIPPAPPAAPGGVNHVNPSITTPIAGRRIVLSPEVTQRITKLVASHEQAEDLANRMLAELLDRQEAAKSTPRTQPIVSGQDGTAARFGRLELTNGAMA